MTGKHYIFVIENVLGHVTHGMNIERVLGSRDDITGTVIKISMGHNAGVRSLPLVKNWSVQASWAARRSLQQHLRRQRADALFVHTQVAALFINSIMRDVPTVVSIDATPINFDTMADAYHHEHHIAPIERIKLAVNRRALREAKSVVTWSKWAADSAIDDYGLSPERVHAIAPGVDIARFTPRVGDRAPGPLRVLFVGGDFERKGGPELLAAVRDLDEPVELEIVSGAANIVIPAGVIARIHDDLTASSNRMTDLYRAADIFALPTRGDCTPLAVAEALASGLPIVATDVGSMPDMVLDGENGVLVAPRDRHALTAALAKLAGSPDLRAAMGKRSRELAEREHDSDANCARLFDVLDRISPPAFDASRGDA